MGVHQLVGAKRRPRLGGADAVLPGDNTAKASFRTPKTLFLHSPSENVDEKTWGDEKGDKGYWTMYDDWFDEYVYKVIIHKKHLPKGVLDVLKTEPIVLPPWDPM